MTEPLLFELASTQRPGPRLPTPGVKTRPIDELVPRGLRRTSTLPIPSVAEQDLARHFGRLGRMNFSLHQGLYPLGSCTMKYNPAVNEALARLDDFAELHPYHPPARAQGALRLMWELERALLALTAMDRMSLQPAAGAHGEWTGLRMIQAYHRSRGETRDEVLVPDSAHGTNPASATLSHLKTVAIKSGPDGQVQLDDLKSKLSPKVAAVMLTNPNTLGLFEKDILEIGRLAHEQGVQLYYDGANLNALVGVARPGDMGFDVVHLNLHKTFSTPHGGGGPGSGPVAFAAALAPHAPLPWIEHGEGGRALIEHAEGPTAHSIGRLKGFHGQMGMFVRALAYMMSHGADGLRQVAEDAVLNANYLRVRLQGALSLSYPGSCMHEVLFDDRFLKDTGITTLDFAKAMIDEGFHPMTMYFPLVVHGALLIEPTETESKAALDQFADTVNALAARAKGGDAARFHVAPRLTPRRRLDETAAARKPVLRWQPEVPKQEAAE